MKIRDLVRVSTANGSNLHESKGLDVSPRRPAGLIPHGHQAPIHGKWIKMSSKILDLNDNPLFFACFVVEGIGEGGISDVTCWREYAMEGHR